MKGRNVGSSKAAWGKKGLSGQEAVSRTFVRLGPTADMPKGCQDTSSDDHPTAGGPVPHSTNQNPFSSVSQNVHNECPKLIYVFPQ